MARKNPHHTFVPQFSTMSQYVMHYKDTIEALGFAVEGSNNHFEVFEFFKNGKQKKTPFASAMFYPTTGGYDDVIDGEAREVNTVPTERPWRNDGRSLRQGKTTSNLRTAAAMVLDEVALTEAGKKHWPDHFEYPRVFRRHVTYRIE